MPKPSKARGRGGSALGGRSAAPAGTSGRAKSQRNGAGMSRWEREERVPESLVVASDESEEASGSEESGSEEGSASGEEEEDGEEEEEEEEEETQIGVPVAMWVSPPLSSLPQHNQNSLSALLARTSTTVTLNDVQENV